MDVSIEYSNPLFLSIEADYNKKGNAQQYKVYRGKIYAIIIKYNEDNHGNL